MWETYIAGAAGLLGFYVAMRREIRRSYELLHKDISHLTDRADRADSRADRFETRIETGFTDVRADLRRVDAKIDMVRGELIGFLGPR